MFRGQVGPGGGREGGRGANKESGCVFCSDAHAGAFIYRT